MARLTPFSAAGMKPHSSWPRVSIDSIKLSRHGSLACSLSKLTPTRLFLPSVWNIWKAFPLTAPNSTPRAWLLRNSWAAFLKAISVNTLRREADHKKQEDILEHYRYWHEFAQNNLFGLEINEELARVAKMNMIIHDDGHTNFVGHDALDFFPKLTHENPGLAEGKFDLVLTNPPFGAAVKRVEKNEGYLEQFELRHFLSKNATGIESNESIPGEGGAKRRSKSIKLRASIKTEIVFLERVHASLKPGTGRVAIVLPDGILSNASLQGVRNWLLTHFQLLAVVSLPQFAFAHYDAGVKASLVFMRRLAEGETVPDDAPIFMALAENIGYDATGRKTFSVTVESETPEKEKVEIQRCDLFDYRVFYEWSAANPKKPDWSERHREIIPDTGLVAQWRAFQKDPTPFFV